MNKRILAVALTVMCFFSVSVNVNSDSISTDYSISNSEGRIVKVTLEDKNLNVTKEELQELVNANLDADEFVIYDVGEAVEDKEILEKGTLENINKNDAEILAWNPPLFSTYKYETDKNITVKERAVKDEFIISAAKGETVTRSTTYVGKLTGSITGQYFKKSELGIKASVSYTVSTEKKYKGPSENSKYNAREYRVKYYRQDGEFTQREYCYRPNGSLYGIRHRKGSFKEPTKYISYSKDYNID